MRPCSAAAGVPVGCLDLAADACNLLGSLVENCFETLFVWEADLHVVSQQGRVEMEDVFWM